MVTHPASTTHCRLSPEERVRIGISDNLVRLSIGLEQLADLQHDIVQALANGLACPQPDASSGWKSMLLIQDQP